VARPRALKNCGANGETRIGRHGAKKRCSLQGQARATPRPPEVMASSSGWLAAQTNTNTAACTVEATVGRALVGANLGWHETADQGRRLPELRGADQGRPLPRFSNNAANMASAQANNNEWLAPRWPNASAYGTCRANASTSASGNIAAITPAPNSHGGMRPRSAAHHNASGTAAWVMIEGISHAPW